MPFGRGQPQLTGADFLMGAAQQGRDLGKDLMQEFQSMLFDAAGGLGEPGDEDRFLQALIGSPLKDHEQAAAWVVEEATRVGILRREFETVREAVALGLRLALKFEAYLRAKGTVFLDVDPFEVGRGQGYRHFEPLPGTAPLDVGEEFVALGESFRRMRGSYAISTEFILSLKEQYDRGSYRPELNLVVPAAMNDPGDDLPDGPVTGWGGCPNCGGGLRAVRDAAECLACRHIWCGPRRKPLLDATGKLIGTEERLPDIEGQKGWDAIAVYIRGPREGPVPLPEDAGE